MKIHTAQMQVQDFTVIRISPIVYNDRDILEIRSYSTLAPNWARKHTHKRNNKIIKLNKCVDAAPKFMHGRAQTTHMTPHGCGRTPNKESPLVLAAARSVTIRHLREETL